MKPVENISGRESRGMVMNRRTFVQLAAGATLAQPLLTDALHAAANATGFRFSVMLWTLEKQFPFERCVEIAAEAGYNGVQLVGEFQKWTTEDTQRMMSRIHSLGLVVDSMSGVRAGFSTVSDTEIFMSQVKEQLEAAKRLECPQIILLSGKRMEELSPAAQTQTSAENLKRTADLAANDHIEIVIEPIDALENPSILLETVTDAFDIVGQVGRPNVKVLYDFYHEQRGFGNLIEKLVNHIDKVGLVHIADVPGRHEPGTGEINYATIYRKLADLRYDKFIAMEYYPTGNAVDSLKNARIGAVQAIRGGHLSTP
jgi:hydroxypyruvate isomerase